MTLGLLVAVKKKHEQTHKPTRFMFYAGMLSLGIASLGFFVCFFGLIFLAFDPFIDLAYHVKVIIMSHKIIQIMDN